MNSKGLASNRRKKKGGRAAVIPLGEVNPPPAPEGRGYGVLLRVLDRLPEAEAKAKSPALKAYICLKIPAKLKKRVFSPPGLRIPPGRPKWIARNVVFFDQNFDHFLELDF